MTIEAESPQRPVADLRRTAFLVSVVGYLLFLYLFSPFSSLFLGWFVDFEDNISHKVHEVTFGVLFALIFAGIAVQLRNPERKVASLQQAIVVSALLSIVVAASTGWEWAALLYVVPPLLIADLHPARREVFRVPHMPSGGLLFLVLLASIPFLAGFGDEFGKAVDKVRGHQAHWGGMATFALTIPALGLLASTKPRGWRAVAWATGGSVIVFGAASVAFPFDASARADTRAFVILVWGVLFLYIAEREARRSVVTATLSAAPAGKAVLRRSKEGRGLAGVARGLARYLSVPTAAVRILFMVPPVGLVAYMLCWWLIPLEASGDFVRVASRSRGSRVLERVILVAGAAAAVVVGFVVYGIADTAIAPRVPHDVDSAVAISCLACHGTGRESAPVIDAATHNFYDEIVSRRSFIPQNLCESCHQLPPLSPAAFLETGPRPLAALPGHHGVWTPLDAENLTKLAKNRAAP